MERTLSSELRSRVGSRVQIAGWLHHQRRLSRRTFVLVRDRAGIAQVVVEEDNSSEQLLPETVLEVEGLAVASDAAPGGAEIHEPLFRVVAAPRENLKVTTPLDLAVAETLLARRRT